MGASKDPLLWQFLRSVAPWRAFTHFLKLLDDPCWDDDVASIRDYAKEKLEGRRGRTSTLPSNLDVVCTGGGFKNCYSAGVILALRQSGIKFERYAGASAGAQLAFIMMTGQFEDCLRWALTVAATFSKFPFVRPGPMWEYFYRRCADRAPVPTEGAFTVSVTELVSVLPPVGHNRLVSDFGDQKVVGDGLIATGAVPLFICRGPWMRWEGMRVLDGGLTNNTPRFRDGRRHQLVVTFASLEERFKGRSCGIYWSAAEMLEVIRWGIHDAVALLDGESPPGLQILEAEASKSIPPSPPVSAADIFRMVKRVYLKM